ncbi:Ni/Fe-hydrogenase, b-type cytochrome subunit [Acidocella sp.]|jgi:Ni/Fe-hydrogenase 1 B-type cytochrome subunit|uniref:Ni/Fe-hydrogenase, b-type cytochrome subunit n=1 Tax=Acidocella sp. TaxID=50710 RepID=UPI002631F0D2|nr:Ni/Fe-hydrogenase, b-type cytochrome subunit [Acidocella sp.]
MSAPTPHSVPAGVVKAPVYVYELPVRIWHWVNLFAFALLVVTGLLIASPIWPQLDGEPYHLYVMGWVREIHFVSAYIFTIGFAVRIYWMFVGNEHAREIFLPAVWSCAWWKNMWATIRWYLLIDRESPIEVGHNPLAQAAMFLFFVLGALFQIVTGFALYGEGAGGWSAKLFTSWVIPLFGGSMEVHTWHHLAMWYILVFVIIHVYMVIREDIMSRASIVSAMINGWRMFKDNRP